MSTRSKSQQNIRSTDRAGTLMLTLGILVLTFGIALMMGVFAQTTSISLSVLKSTAIGLGGIFHQALPFFLVWLGAQLCVSSKRTVSFRLVLLGFAFYICLLAFVTIITSVKGYGSLMDYIQNLNLNFMGYQDSGSMGAYLSSAFRQFGGRIDPMPGGGLLGMLLAYPFWRMLGIAGTVTLLVLTLLILFFLMIRVNPVALIQVFSEKRSAGQMQGQVESAEPAAHRAEEPVPQPTTARTASTHVAPVYDEPIEPVYTPQAPVYQDEPVYIPYSTEEIPAYQNNFAPVTNRDAYTPTSYVDEGFVPAKGDMDTIYQQTSELMPKKSTPIVPVQPVVQPEYQEIQPVQVRQTVPPEPVKPQQIPVDLPLSEPVIDEYQDESDMDAVPWVEEVVEKPVSNKVKQVHVAPAVDLGQRVTIPQKPKALNPNSLDGTAHKGPTHKQIELPRDDYEKPPLRLLSAPPMDNQIDHTEEDQSRADKIVQTLNSFGIPVSVQQIVHGPAITRFAIRLGEGVNVNRLRNLMDNLSVELLAKSPVRAEIPIPGTPLIGIEVSNEKATTVFLTEVLNSPKMQENKSPTTVALGKDIAGTPILCDLMDMPHLLIAGATGSGKSVCINSIITSLLYRASPQDVRLILVDPKFVELQPYNGCPHLLLPVITDDKKVVAALEWLCEEMDERYQKMQVHNVRNIDNYNRRIGPDEEKMPRIVMIIDEMADLIATSGKAVEEYVKRLTAKARAAGICLILATQRPSVNVITGVIKANIPSRIAFQVSSQVDSRTILDMIGAEKLLGYGDMLYMPRNYPAPARVQGCFISDKDVEAITEYVKSRNQLNYNMDIMDYIDKVENADQQRGADSFSDEGEVFDELLPDAIEMAVEAGQTSISMLQRVLRVGYGRAGRLIDEMDRRGIISGNEGTKPRKTLMTREEYSRLVEAGDSKVT